MPYTVLATHRQYAMHKFYTVYWCRSLITVVPKFYSSFECSKKVRNALLTSLPLIQFHAKFKSTYDYEDGLIRRTLKKMKFHMFTKTALFRNGCILYTRIDQNVDTKKFFEFCQMPDTFYSWYRVMELHIWMLCVRCMAEGETGKVIRNVLISSFYKELDERSKQLENAISSIRKKEVMELYEYFQGALLTYDQTLSGDDRRLANVLWCTLFSRQESSDILHIECCVNYVRRNLVHLDSIRFEEMILNKKISFLPLLEPKQLLIK